MRSLRRTLFLRLHDIIEAINQAQAIVADMEFEAFSQDRLRQLAAERTIEIISEASRYLPEEMKQTAGDVPWRQIAGIGNILRHVYDRVEPETVWQIIRDDLPALRIVAERMLAELPERD